MSDRHFVGRREAAAVTVFNQQKQLDEEFTTERARVSIVQEGRDDRPLPHYVLHSPDGFEWGHEGSGPADLALALLAEASGEGAALQLYLEEGGGSRSTPICLRLHQIYKHRVVAKFPMGEEFELPEPRVQRWLAAARRGEYASAR